MGWDEIQYGIQDDCQNWKILKFFNDEYPTNDGRRFFSGSMRPALWVFILKMNTLVDIKI